MKQILYGEICREKPNAASLGAFNQVLSNGGSVKAAISAAEKAPTSKANAKTNRTLVPATNFKAEKVKNFKVQNDAHKRTFVNGWGIRDKSANAWVSLNKTIEGQVAPSIFASQSVAEKAVSGGLFKGYKTVKRRK